MSNKYLDISGRKVNMHDITYDELVELYENFIKNNGYIPKGGICKSENNLPTTTIIKRLLDSKNMSRLEFYSQFKKFGEQFKSSCIVDSAPWMINYIKGGYETAKKYTCKSNKKITFKCPDCGHEFQRDISYVYYYGFRCQKCDDGISYPNKFSYALLDQLKNLYEIKNIQHEYTSDWSGRRRYDNYFEYQGQAYILEMDGGFHKNGIYTTSEYGLSERKNADKEKDIMAETHDIIMIRVDCEPSTFDNIKENVCNSLLSKLFDLTLIDWDKCNISAMKNIVKKVCDDFKNNSELTVSELSEKYGIYTTTVAKYLKQGTELGWCNYNPEFEKRKFQALRYGYSISVNDIKNNIQKQFKSIAQAERESFAIFGRKLCHTTISRYIDTNVEYDGFMIYRLNKNGLKGSEINESA